jgi:acyl-CoA hydrolase
MTEIVLPGHTNALGTIFGGQLMAWIDIAGRGDLARAMAGLTIRLKNWQHVPVESHR